MARRWWGLALGSAIGATLACGPVGLGTTEKMPVPEVQVALETFSLPNGLEVIVATDRSRDVVGLDMTYRVGWLDDPPDRPGLAHLVEHLMFVGLGHLEPDGHDRYMRALGAADVNASTGPAETHYYVVVPTGGLDGAIWIERERMTAGLTHVTPERLAAEVGVVEDEARVRGARSIGARVLREATALVEGGERAFPPAPRLRGVDLARDVAPFHARAYAPNRPRSS